MRFTRVDFHRFKAFESFALHLRAFNILVGPNNSGKSTILAAFRILAAGMRRANQRKAIPVPSLEGFRLGHAVDLEPISVAQENIFFDYDDSQPAWVQFTLSSGAKLQLYFPERGTCFLIPSHPKGNAESPSSFRKRFACPIGFVPILGPVEHEERLFEKEAARRALFNYQAARNFRNIWRHYPEHFDDFRKLIQQTWPGMDIERPEVVSSEGKPLLHMFCPEERIPREIFWAGFGFQVWCQMLTHIVQAKSDAIFLIDEPDIYLHSELQRQLIGILRDLGPDIIIATHSTEIISEAEADDIVLVDKKRRSGRRIKDPLELEEVFVRLGSNLNPILTQLAKTRRAVFVEGKDFQLLGKFARKMGLVDVGSRRTFAVVPVEGFSPERIRALKKGIETTLGMKIGAAAILDRDYRSDDECEAVRRECAKICDFVVVHACKEIENAVLVESAIDRAASRKVQDRNRRAGQDMQYKNLAGEILDDFCESQRSYVNSQRLASRLRYERNRRSGIDEATSNQQALEEFERDWGVASNRVSMVPGKEAVSFLNRRLQKEYNISVSALAIIDAMRKEEIPESMLEALKMLRDFASSKS